MSILLLVVVFILILLNVYHSNAVCNNIIRAMNCATIIFSGIIVVVTELLSCFNFITFNGIFLSWLLIAILCGFRLFYTRKKFNFREFTLSLNFAKSISLGKFYVVIVIGLLLVQGLLYPPNNWDSMTYHMARVAHWVSNKNVNFCPAYIKRQLFMPPFGEYLILNFNLLSKFDYFSNWVQLFFLIQSIFSIFLILDLLKCKYDKWTVAIFTLTIPEVLLQATSTQNDLIMAFFVLSFIFYSFQLVIKENKLSNFLYLGLSGGLAIFTKGVAFPYLVFITVLLVCYFAYCLIKIITVR